MAIDFEETNEIELSPLEYVIHLGAHGNHVLFDNERIRKAYLKKETELADMGSEMVTEIRKALNDLFTIPDFEGKRDYIDDLPCDVQDVLIYLYFQMVEKTMLLNQEDLH